MKYLLVATDEEMYQHFHIYNTLDDLSDKVKGYVRHGFKFTEDPTYKLTFNIFKIEPIKEIPVLVKLGE